MKKICYFINSDWYFDLHWLERAIAAKKNGYQVHIICRFNGDLFINKFDELGFFCYPINLKERSLSIFGFVFLIIKLLPILKSINPDIIHSITIKPIILGGIFSRLKRKAFVANIVGLGRVFSYDNYLYLLIRFFVIRIYRFIFKNQKSRIIFEHEFDKVSLSKYINFYHDQTQVIDGAGVDTALFPYKSEGKLNRPIVFFAGRMLKNKGLKTLVDIRKKLKLEGLAFDLIVAGIEVPDDPHSIPASLIKKWHEDGDISWLGTRNDIAELIDKSSIVALPTMYPEGVPRILIEACAIGRPCIAYNSGGCKSIIEDGVTGFLVDKGNENAFELKLKELLMNPELRHELGKNGRALVAEKFSSKKVISRTLSVYYSLT